MMEAYPGMSAREACELLGVRWDYRVACTLVWNIERPRWRRAAEQAVGTGAATSSADLSPEWAEALTRTPDEAKQLAFQLNADRMLARIRAERRR